MGMAAQGLRECPDGLCPLEPPQIQPAKMAAWLLLRDSVGLSLVMALLIAWLSYRPP